MVDDPDPSRAGLTDRHAENRDRRRRLRMPVSGRSLQHVVNAIAKRSAAAKQSRAAAANNTATGPRTGNDASPAPHTKSET